MSDRPPLTRTTQPLRTIWLTAAALVAFAANSVLCRIALQGDTVDPATFTTIRLVSGALTLLLIASWTQGVRWQAASSWTSSGLLALYAVPFALSYTGLSAGTGALVLFGSVQITMIGVSLLSGERLRSPEWFGVMVALAGLFQLTRPGLAAPPPADAAIMCVAGFAWGMYSLRGRRSRDPLAQTTGNFVRAVPMVLMVSLASLEQFHIETTGVVLAIASGALASGLGYVVWYTALRGLTTTGASVVQLAVPVLAALGGVLFLEERITPRLVVSSVMVLGGILLSIMSRKRSRSAAPVVSRL